MAAAGLQELGIEAGIVMLENGCWVITCRAEQDHCRVDLRRINLQVGLPALLRDMQQSVVTALECHEYEEEQIRELLRIMKAELRGQPDENRDIHWSDEIKCVFELFIRVADRQIEDAATQRVLEPLANGIEQMLVDCIHLYYKKGNYKEKCNLFLDWVRGKHNDSLKTEYFSKKFLEDVSELPADLKGSDGTQLNREKKAKVSKFIREVFTSVTLTAWINFNQIIELYDENSNSGDIKVIIAVTGDKGRVCGTRRLLPQPDVLQQSLEYYRSAIAASSHKQPSRRLQIQEKHPSSAPDRIKEGPALQMREDDINYIDNKLKVTLMLQTIDAVDEPGPEAVANQAADKRKRWSTEYIVIRTVGSIISYLERSRKEADEENAVLENPSL